MLTPVLVEKTLFEAETASPDRSARRVTINLAESPLAWLRARRLVSARQFAAGEALRSDYERANLAQCVTMQWDRSPSGYGGHSKGSAQSTAGAATIAAIDAKRRFDGAMVAAGPGLSDILWRTVCACDAMPVAEKALGWPVRSGRLVLVFALDRIAEYYAIP